MRLTDLVDIINKYWAFITIVLGILGVGLEKSQWIKINPFSDLFGFIGKRINQDLKDELNDLKKKVDDLDNKFDDHIENEDEEKFKAIRQKILDFASNLRRGKNYTIQAYSNIMDRYQDYCAYEEKYHFKNGYCDEEYEYILENFRQHQRDNTFLK